VLDHCFWLFIIIRFRILVFKQGSYDLLPIFYTSMIGIWGGLALVWFGFVLRWYRFNSPHALRMISVAFCIRIGLVVVSRQMWIVCTEMKYLCSSSTITSSTAGFRIFEAGLLEFGYLLVVVSCVNCLLHRAILFIFGDRQGLDNYQTNAHKYRMVSGFAGGSFVSIHIIYICWVCHNCSQTKLDNIHMHIVQLCVCSIFGFDLG
jgi:hypothetical protein